MVALKIRRPRAQIAVSRRRPRPKKAPDGRRRAVTLGVLAVGIVLLFIYCAGFARMWKVDCEYRALQDEMQRLQDQHRTLEIRHGFLTSPWRLEQFALKHDMVRGPTPPMMAELTDQTGDSGDLASVVLTAPEQVEGAP